MQKKPLQVNATEKTQRKHNLAFTGLKVQTFKVNQLNDMIAMYKGDKVTLLAAS